MRNKGRDAAASLQSARIGASVAAMENKAGDLGFEQAVGRALSLLGVDLSAPSLDAFADPEQALQVLESKAISGDSAPLLIKVLPGLQQSSEGFGPPPADPYWLKAVSAQSSVELAPLRIVPEDPLSKAISTRCRGMEIRVEMYPCCDAPSCKDSRAFASLWLLFPGGAGAPDGVIAAEARASSQKNAEAALFPFSNALGSILGVQPCTAEPANSPLPTSEKAPRPAWTALDIARHTLRAEGPRVVLRDHKSRGPKNKAKRLLFISALLILAAGGLWYLFGRSALSGEQGMAVALFAIAALASLTAYAFFGVGRFASRYRAASNPLVVLGNDRVAVAPWVSREGAVNLRPEGRLGAAIPMFEVEGTCSVQRGDGQAVMFNTDHGLIDAVFCPSAPLASMYEHALARTLKELKHPRLTASARQRARARSQ